MWWCHDLPMRSPLAPVVAVAMLASGCWTGHAARTPISDDGARSDDGFAIARDTFPLHSEWLGTYSCTQGESAVALTLDAQRTGKLRATFEFGPTVENPHVPVGAYRLEGTIKPGPEGTFDVALEPVEWISEPDGYIMVPVRARSSRRWSRLVGRMVHGSCGVIDVRRTDANVRGPW